MLTPSEMNTSIQELRPYDTVESRRSRRPPPPLQQTRQQHRTAAALASGAILTVLVHCLQLRAPFPAKATSSTSCFEVSQKPSIVP